MALLRYRITPVAGCPYSPADILMCKLQRETLPTTPDQLAPCVVDARTYLKAEQKLQMTYYDQTAKPIYEFLSGAKVMVLV